MAKLSAKEKIALRKQQEQQKKEQYKQKEEQRNLELQRQKELEEQRKLELQRQKELEEQHRLELQREQELAKKQEEKKKEDEKAIALIEAENPEMKKGRKSKAKAAGLKSTFVISKNRLLVTAFGKGNEACPDKYVTDQVITDATESPALTLRNDRNDFLVSGRVVHEAKVDNPLASKKQIGMDQIRCKEQLEKIYFGQTYEDNIHIQLIYNIMDMEKILTVHMNNIVFEINNLLRYEGDEHFDLIGYMGDRNQYDSFCKKDLYPLFHSLIESHRLAYFDSVFMPEDEQGNKLSGDDLVAFEKKCYYLFSVLGIVRHATAHGEKEYRAKIFQIDELAKFGDAEKELSRLYSDRIKKLNDEFVLHSAKDLEIMYSILGAETPEEKSQIVKEFYDFTILKTYKNMGFSIKKLRECLGVLAPEMKGKEYDTVRRKLNRCLDFIIWKFYMTNKERLTVLVDGLRASTKEAEKEFIYRNEAECLWAEIQNQVRQDILPKMSGVYIRELEGVRPDALSLTDIKITDEADTFSKMIYLMTIFLDSKEINTLLTQLINNFENIGSFVKILKGENLFTPFEAPYKIFEECEKIAKELRVINSFARMEHKGNNAAKFMYLDAARLLGYEEKDNVSLNEYVDRMVNKDKMETVRGRKNSSFRNFIANNVILSNRFNYLVRYGNPAKLKKLACNRIVVDYVLREIPDKQVKTYYNSCNGVDKDYFAEMRDDLAERIVNMDFTYFANVKQRSRNVAEILEKERMKSIIRVYLTVLYLLVKNLVYVNSRYYLAFHCVERDMLLYDEEKYKEIMKSQGYDKRIFAMDFVEKNSSNKRAKAYIKVNYDNSDLWAINAYRNCVEHLSAVRNADSFVGEVREFTSYFDLYHFLVQKSLMQQFEYDSTTESRKVPGTMILDAEKVNPKLMTYFKLVEKYKTYCKDFVKALNVPFAYNLARYKNLSINELFDRNNYLPDENCSMEPALVGEE